MDLISAKEVKRENKVHAVKTRYTVHYISVKQFLCKAENLRNL